MRQRTLAKKCKVIAFCVEEDTCTCMLVLFYLTIVYRSYQIRQRQVDRQKVRQRQTDKQTDRQTDR